MRKPVSISMAVTEESIGYSVVCDDGKMYVIWDSGTQSGGRWYELPPVPQDKEAIDG